MMSPGHDGVTAKQLTCPTLAHPAMGTDVYWIQGYECFKFVSIFSKAWKGRHLRPPCRSIPSPPASSPISIPIPLILYMFSCESPHTFLAQANLQCSLSSLRSSQTCCLTQKSSLHVCAAGRGQQGLPVSPFPPTNRKVAPRRQESRSLLAGCPGLSPSDLSVRTPRWAFHSGSSLALVTSCHLPYPPTPPQFRMGLRD